MRCGRCCTSFGVCVTPFDIKRISQATGMDPISFVMAIPEPPDRERTEPAVIIDGERSLIVLRWSTENICGFYSGTGCKIYDDRPLLCRTYPFNLDNGQKLADMKSRACPKKWTPASARGYLADLKKYKKEIEAYQKIADEWNAKDGGSLSSFLSFVLDRNNPGRF